MEGHIFVECGSRKGRGVFFSRGFMFTYQKTLKSGREKWVCASNKKFKCKAHLNVVDKVVVDSDDAHNHVAETKEGECKIRADVRRTATTNVANPPSQIVNSVLRDSPASKVNSRQVKRLRQIAYRSRRKLLDNMPIHTSKNEPSSLGEMADKSFPHKVGFIGAGNMAKAIGVGILDSGFIGPQDLIISAPSDRNLKLWMEKGVQTTHDNAAVVNFSDIVFIAVKPQYFPAMVEGLQKSSCSVSKPKCFVSIMVGKTIEGVKEALKTIKWIGTSFEVIKVMPNTPSMVGAGCSVMVRETDSKFAGAVRQIMQQTGVCEEIPESLMNACGALSGSGPAYLYMVIEALADGGVKKGIPRELAYKLAAQTMVGAGKMVLESGKHPGVLKDEVCSPGGTTITAVHALEKAGVRSAFINAIEAAVERSEHLSK